MTDDSKCFPIFLLKSTHDSAKAFDSESTHNSTLSHTHVCWELTSLSMPQQSCDQPPWPCSVETPRPGDGVEPTVSATDGSGDTQSTAAPRHTGYCRVSTLSQLPRHDSEGSDTTQNCCSQRSGEPTLKPGWRKGGAESMGSATGGGDRGDASPPTKKLGDIMSYIPPIMMVPK